MTTLCDGDTGGRDGQASPQPQYEYTDLPGPTYIRLLHVEPAPSLKDPIRCTLECYDLYDASRPKFVALSYAWGPVHKDGRHLTHTIQCGHLQFRVTEHLLAGLRHIRQFYQDPVTVAKGRRYCSDPVTLAKKDAVEILWYYKEYLSAEGRRDWTCTRFWVDAICIAQMDTAERERQVSLMGDIFSSAIAVSVWLGDFNFENRTETFRDFFSEIMSQSNLLEKQIEEMRAFIRNMHARSWFQRRWVLQEVRHAQSRTLLFGASAWDIVTIREFFISVELHEPPGLRAMLEDHRYLDPLHLLTHYDACQCSDDRDRIYALLSMMRYGRIRPDYTIDVEQAFIRFAKAQLEEGGLLPLLASATSRLPIAVSVNRGTLPYWVPDWRVAPSQYSTCDHKSCVSGYVQAAAHEPQQIVSLRYQVIGDRWLLLKGWLFEPCTDEGAAWKTCMCCCLHGISLARMGWSRFSCGHIEQLRNTQGVNLMGFVLEDLGLVTTRKVVIMVRPSNATDVPKQALVYDLVCILPIEWDAWDEVDANELCGCAKTIWLA